MYSFIQTHWLPITIVVIIITLWIIYEFRHPLRETFTMETETHLVVDKYGKLIESAEFKIETV